MRQIEDRRFPVPPGDSELESARQYPHEGIKFEGERCFLGSNFTVCSLLKIRV